MNIYNSTIRNSFTRVTGGGGFFDIDTSVLYNFLMRAF